MNRRIFSLDLDKDRIICTSASIDSKNTITSFCIEKSESLGIEKGKVTDINLLTKSIKDCANSLQKKIDAQIKKFYVNFLSEDINLKSVFGAILLKEGTSKVVTEKDIEKVIQTTCSLNLNKDERLLHKITKRFILDEKVFSKDPRNLYGHKLAVEISLITLPVSDIENILKAIQNAGFGVEDFVFSGLSVAEAVMPEDKEKFILIDIKRDLTEMLYFEDEILKDLKIFDFGSEDLTKDLAKSLDLPIPLAEELKESHGSLEKSPDKDKQIFIKTNSSYKPIKKDRVSDVLYSSVDRMLNSLKREIPEDFYSQGSLVITGDIVFLDGFLEFAESFFGLPVVMGRVKNFLSLQDSVLSVGNFGLTLYALKRESPKTIKNPLLKTLEKLKGIYQDYF